MLMHHFRGPDQMSLNSLIVSTSLILLALTQLAQAQFAGKTTAPISGGTGISSELGNNFRGMAGTYAPAHKTPDGRPCIAIHPMTRAQIIHPKIMDQIVIVNNICGEAIKVQICYVSSSDCIIVPLGGYQRLQRTLGIGSTFFRYEYRELY
ncbi:hypothetical protein [Bradyrhizobium sp. RT3b]|uniref:hypothetical protein n=1 Tax=Bradyrhizobium sp. RT3b TaxID=3156334 RepID=UPI00339AEDBF